MSVSDKGNKYVVVLQDYFSKWPEAKAFTACNAANITSWLRDNVFPRFGLPAEIVTDHGPQFDAQQFKEFCNAMGIQHTFSTVYHHQSNGLVERLNRSLLNLIRVYLEKDQKNWDDHLIPSLFAYRTSVHSTTKKTPFETIHIRTPRMPIDMVYPTTINANVLDVIEKMKTIRTEVRGNLRKSDKTRKIKYDDKHKVKGKKLEIGDLVYWRRKVLKSGQSTKLAPSWIGPFKVKAKCSTVNFEIVGANGKSVIVHGNLLKLCHD